METIIEVKNLVREYGDIKVLRGINFSADKGEFISIMGRSGSGKTTFLKVLGLVDKPTLGSVFFRGEDSEHLWESQLADIRRREIGFVHQDARLMNCLTVEQNIKLPLILDKKDTGTMQMQLESLAGHFEIATLMKKYPAELSGGEMQRVAVCRALIHNPELILADEPTGSLDNQAQKTIIEALLDINENLGKTIILVTHNPKIASYSKKTILLKDGLILDTLLHPDGEKSETQRIFYHMIMEKMEILS